MVLDIDTPILQILTLNGRLSFLNDTDLHLQAKQIFIRAGELIVGYDEKPFANKAIITLHGRKDETAMVYDGSIEAGNKLIANINKIKMVGAPRQ